MFLENIDRLDKKDFSDPELYKEIMELPTNMEREMAADRLRERASDLRIKTKFDEMYKAVKRDLKIRITAGATLRNNETNFTILENISQLPEKIAEDMAHIPGQLKCGNYVCDDTGVKILTEKGVIEICPHPIVPIRVLRNVETGKYKVEIVFYLRGKTQNIFVPREILASQNKILELAAYSIIVKSRSSQFLCEYFADMEKLNENVLREFSSSGKLGWIKDGDTTCFLPYHKDIVYDNMSDYKTLYDSITSSGSRERWYNCVKEIRARRQPEVLINLAASFASVLAGPCETLPFIVSLWGGTGIGKSVILKLCASVWGDPADGKFISDPKATAVATELRLDALNSLPLLLDDMAQVRNQDDDYSQLIYYWCSGNGKARGTQNMGLRRGTTWRNCTITNGERSMVDEFTQGGAINRVIDIESSGDILFDGPEGHKTIKTISKNYGFAGEEFVDLVMEIGFPEVNRLYGLWYDKIRETAKEEGVEKEDKQAMAMALILVADYLIQEHLFKDGVNIDITKAISYLRNKGEISEVEATYNMVMDMVRINSKKFADNLSEPEPEGTESWGVWVDANTVAMWPWVLTDRIIKSGNLEKAFLSWAKRKGILKYDKGKNQKNVRWCSPKPKKMIVLDTTYGQDDEDLEDINPFDKQA